MSNLYTLQECFEQAGSAFPFEVIMHWFGRPIRLNFIKRLTIDELPEETRIKVSVGPPSAYFWYHAKSKEGDLGTRPEECIHIGFAESIAYTHKEIKFERDMDNILHENTQKT